MPNVTTSRDAPRLAVRALLLRSDRILLMGAVDIGDPRVRWWELPGGGIERGESREQALRRELREETGYVDVDVGPAVVAWQAEWVFSDRIVHQRDVVHVVALRSDERIEAQPEPHEGVAELARWVPVDELADLPARLIPPALTPALIRQVTTDPPARPRELPVEGTLP